MTSASTKRTAWTVDATIHAPLLELPPRLAAAVVEALTIDNPEYTKRERLGLWLGDTPADLFFAEVRGDELCLPRGASFILRGCARDLGLVEVVFDDRRALPAERLEELPAVPLRDYQARAVAELVRVTQGIVTLPCGSGKTRAAIGAIAKLRTPALVLVHTLDLAAQWIGELRNLLGVEPGFIGGGEERHGAVIVAMVQTLSKWVGTWPRDRGEVQRVNEDQRRCPASMGPQSRDGRDTDSPDGSEQAPDPDRLDSFLSRFGLLVLDEAHHVGAATFAEIVNRCPARYRLGLSATPYREDGLSMALELYLGRPLVTVDHEDLIAAGVLVAPRFEVVETSFEYDYEETCDYVPMISELIADPDRNRLVVDRVVADVIEGHVCLVLSNRVAHCTTLAAALQARGVRAEALTGKTPKRRRAELLDQARAGELQALVATQLADEGLDVPILSRVYLVAPAKAHGRTIQRVGRVMRPGNGKLAPVVVDFVDVKVGVLKWQHRARRRSFATVLGAA